MIQVMKDSRSRWQPLMGKARIFWGLFTNDKWLELEGRHQRRTSLMMPTNGFAQSDFASRQPISSGFFREKGV
jgi:hypothetical protein